MTTPVIIDAIAVFVLAAFTLMGARKGLLRALAGLLVIVVSLAGAHLISAALARPAAKLLVPMVERSVQSKLEEALQTGLPGQMPESGLGLGADFRLDQVDLPAEELLELLGLDREIRVALTEKVQATIRETGATVVSAVVESVAQSILRQLLYMVSFVVLTVLLRLLLRLLDAVLYLPGLRGLNTAGGGLLGLLEGALLLFFVAWVLRHLGSFETGPLAGSHLLRFFAVHSPMSALAFFQ